MNARPKADLDGTVAAVDKLAEAINKGWTGLAAGGATITTADIIECARALVNLTDKVIDPTERHFLFGRPSAFSKPPEPAQSSLGQW
ncbi:hypothetical protein ACQCX5_14460 [Propionibacteriaceae bacterium G57]|uniref:hypothetical protein n=1 Tax=Aestuariimicrobium sp. G57 TaxID=3418485 RepID=UPI003DA770ED